MRASRGWPGGAPGSSSPHPAAAPAQRAGRQAHRVAHAIHRRPVANRDPHGSASVGRVLVNREAPLVAAAGSGRGRQGVAGCGRQARALPALRAGHGAAGDRPLSAKPIPLLTRGCGLPTQCRRQRSRRAARRTTGTSRAPAVKRSEKALSESTFLQHAQRQSPLERSAGRPCLVGAHVLLRPCRRTEQGKAQICWDCFGRGRASGHAATGSSAGAMAATQHPCAPPGPQRAWYGLPCTVASSQGVLARSTRASSSLNHRSCAEPSPYGSCGARAGGRRAWAAVARSGKRADRSATAAGHVQLGAALGAAHIVAESNQVRARQDDRVVGVVGLHAGVARKLARAAVGVEIVARPVGLRAHNRRVLRLRVARVEGCTAREARRAMRTRGGGRAWDAGGVRAPSQARRRAHAGGLGLPTKVRLPLSSCCSSSWLPCRASVGTAALTPCIMRAQPSHRRWSLLYDSSVWLPLEENWSAAEGRRAQSAGAWAGRARQRALPRRAHWHQHTLPLH